MHIQNTLDGVVVKFPTGLETELASSVKFEILLIMAGIRRKNLVAVNDFLIFLISSSRFQVSFLSLVPKFVFIILKLQYQINNIAWEVAKANSLVGELSTEVPNECTEVL